MTNKPPPKGKDDESLGENPSKPGRKMPSDYGVGRENSKSPGDAGQSPPGKM